MVWLGRACGLRGQKTLAVALASWFVAGLRSKKDHLRLTTDILARLGVTDRFTKYRALKTLEEAGLIQVDREQGRNPFVTIL